MRIVLCYRFCCYGMRYVRPAVQIVTNPLPISYCISSTTYATTIYNVNNKRRKLQDIRNNWKFPEINKNNSKHPCCICAKCCV